MKILLEHILYHCIMKHLIAHQILNDKQYDFIHERPSYNIVEEIQQALDCHLSVDLIFIDIHRAFDTVSHQHLLKKLYHYGIQGNVHTGHPAGLLREYNRLSSRVIVHLCSCWFWCSSGTILGPLMFLMSYVSLVFVVSHIYCFHFTFTFQYPLLLLYYLSLPYEHLCFLKSIGLTSIWRHSDSDSSLIPTTNWSHNIIILLISPYS